MKSKQNKIKSNKKVTLKLKTIKQMLTTVIVADVILILFGLYVDVILILFEVYIPGKNSLPFPPPPTQPHPDVFCWI